MDYRLGLLGAATRAKQLPEDYELDVQIALVTAAKELEVGALCFQALATTDSLDETDSRVLGHIVDAVTKVVSDFTGNMHDDQDHLYACLLEQGTLTLLVEQFNDDSGRFEAGRVSQKDAIEYAKIARRIAEVARLIAHC